MPFVKNRVEKDAFEVGFLNRLATAETITSATVAVEWAAIYEWVPVTEDFVLGTPGVSSTGKTVQFTLKAAPTDDDQPAGAYRVVCTALTSTGRSLVGIVELTVSV